MLKVVWNFVKYFIGIFQRLLYPAKRLICRRRKLSASDAIELTSIGTGDNLQMTNSVAGSLPQNDADLEMEPWDSWGGGDGPGGHGKQDQQRNFYGNLSSGGPMDNAYNYQEKMSADGQGMRNHGAPSHQHHQAHLRNVEPEPEPEINFFENMTPAVQKQKKFLIRKKEMAEAFGVSNRLAVTSDVPMQTSELESWEDTGNAWEDTPESVEDLSWQADEAIREKKKKDRLERQMEQQRKKQRKDEMRGLKGGGSMAATKLS